MKSIFNMLITFNRYILVAVLLKIFIKCETPKYGSEVIRMNLIEYGRKTLPGGTIIYSYMNTKGSYLINLRNIDTNEESGTAGINIPKTHIHDIMYRLMENNITPNDAGTFIFNEVHDYFEQHPLTPKKAHSKYLYL